MHPSSRNAYIQVYQSKWRSPHGLFVVYIGILLNPLNFQAQRAPKEGPSEQCFLVLYRNTMFFQLKKKKKSSEYSVSLARLQFCPSARVARCPLTIWCTSFNQAQVPTKDWFRFLTQDFSGGKQRRIRGMCFVSLITSVGMCVSHNSNQHLCSALHFQITV